jgi:hypothetical protein
MIEKTKVLAAMLVLDEFTPEQLGRFAGVKVETARTVLHRHRHLIEEIGKVTTGRRGGQPVRYHLTANGRAVATKQLEDTFGTLGTPSSNPIHAFLAQLGFKGRSAVTAPAEAPLGIAVADDTLERLVPAAASQEERLDLLKLAEKEAKSALQDLDDTSQTPRIREIVESRLADIRARRAAIHEQNDMNRVATLVAGRVTSRGALMANIRRVVSRWRERQEERPLHLQLWVDNVPSAAEIRMRVARTLEKRAEILLGEVPADSRHLVEVGDAVFLLVDSRNANAQKSFQRAFDTCKIYDRPLYVLDRGYSSGFRNLVFGTGAADYVPDIATLDETGIEKFIRRIPRPAAYSTFVRGHDSQTFAVAAPTPPTLTIRGNDPKY